MSDWPPTRCDMPDLSHLPTNRTLSRMMSQVLAGAGYPADHKADSLLTGLVRVTDKAIREYGFARRELTEYVTERLHPSPEHAGSFHVSPLIHATDHMENCIDSLKRSFRLAEGLLRNPSVMNVSKGDLPAETDRKRLTKLRNQIQHHDDLIVQGQPGDAIGLRVHGDEIDVGGAPITYVELASWLEQMSKLTAKLVP